METNLRQTFIRQGLMLGFLQVAGYYFIYFINRSLLADFWVGLVLLLVIAIYPIIVAVKFRKQNDGYLSLREGFQLVFMISVIRGLIATAFTLILFFVIDPSLEKYVNEKIIENTTRMMQRFGQTEEQMQVAIDRLRAKESQFSIKSQLQGFGFGLVISAFFSLIVALILKKVKPIFDTNPPSAPAETNDTPVQ